MTDDALYHLVASIKQKSEHPLGKAIVSDYTSHHEAPLTAVEDVTIVPGKGLEATMNGESSTRVLAGNAAMMNVSGVTIPDSVKADAASYLGRGASIIYVAVNHVLEGFLALADRVRFESRDVVDDLHSLNVTSVLLTGDHGTTARHIAKRLNMSHVIADCLPEDKMNTVSTLQQAGHVVAMVGTLSPVWGALVHNGGSLLVVLNSVLLLSWKYKTNSDEDRNPYVGKLVSNQ